MIDLRQIANNTIPNSKEKYIYSDEVFNTDDIVKAVQQAHSLALPQTKKLAAVIPGNTKIEYCRNLYNLLFDNVKYKPDVIGTQYVQLPSEVWNSKVCDCKSFSLFIATTLQNKGIEFQYRFVSYVPGSKKVTHVYIVVPSKAGEIIMDVVYKKFNKEKKPFYYHKTMKKDRLGLHIVGRIGNIDGISGAQIGAAIDDEKKKTPFNFGGRDVTQMSEAEFTLWMARDRAELLKQAVEGITGIGSLKAEQFNDRIDVLDDALDSVQARDAGEIDDNQLQNELATIEEQAINGFYSIAPQIAGGEIGKGFFKRIAKKVKTKVKKAVARRKEVIKKVKKKVGKTKVGKFLVKAVEKRNAALKKVAKTAAKVVSAPIRKIIETVIKKKLPKSAPHFLYLFIPKDQVSKFPQKVQDKRKKQEKLKSFIVDKVGMKESQFMGIVRNGIIKKYKKEPEKVIDDMAKGMNVSFVAGIGSINLDSYKGAYDLINEIGRLDRQLKRKPKRFNLSPDDSPNPNDLENVRRVRVRRIANKKGTEKKKVLELTKGKNIKRFSKPVYSEAHRNRLKRLRPRIRKAAPAFTYLFFPKKSLNKLPANIRVKRKKQELLANRITNDAQMSKADFMTEVRKGIKGIYGREPEDVLAGFINGQFTGDEVGIIKSILDLLNSIVGLFKKKDKKPTVTTDDVPDIADFGFLVDDINDKKKQIAEIEKSDLSAKEKRQATKELEKDIKAKEKILKKAEKAGYTETKATVPTTSDLKSLATNTVTDLANDLLTTPNSEKPGLVQTAANVYNSLQPQTAKAPTAAQPTAQAAAQQPYNVDMEIQDDEPTGYSSGGTNFWSSLS